MDSTNEVPMYSKDLQDLIDKTKQDLTTRKVTYHQGILTDQHIYFFLMNDKFDLVNTAATIEMYLGWRKKFSSGDPIKEIEVANEINDRKTFFSSVNKRGAACLVLKVKNNIPGKNSDEEKMKFLMYNFDKAMFNLKKHKTGKMCVIWDREGSDGDKNYDKKFSEKLSDYRTMLKRDNLLNVIDAVYVIDMGVFYTMLWNIAKLFLSTALVSKIFLLGNKNELKSHFNLECLPKEYGGLLDLE